MTSASSAAEKSRRPAWLVLLAVTLLLALHHALAVGSKLHQSTTSAANPALPPALQFIRAWETIDANIGAQGKSSACSTRLIWRRCNSAGSVILSETARPMPSSADHCWSSA